MDDSNRVFTTVDNPNPTINHYRALIAVDTKGQYQKHICLYEGDSCLEFAQDKAITAQILIEGDRHKGIENTPHHCHLYKHIPRIPVSPEQKVWRYLEHYKFEDLINSGKLYLNRLDRFSDQLEGKSPKSCEEALLIDKELSEQQKQESIGLMYERFENNRRCTFLSCWTIQDVLTDKMWETYAMGKDSICVETTYQRIKDATRVSERPLQLERIRYIEEPSFNQETYWFPSLFKQSQYAFENELRIAAYGYNLPNFEFIRFTIDLPVLIHKIHLHPDAGTEEKAKIESLITAAGLESQIVKGDKNL